jgi:DNA-binding transcriptional LysR family regulator
MDSIKAMQVFVEVAKQQSFTRAAEQLHISRASASRYVDFLEQHFAIRLLQRNTRKLSLTDAGNNALRHCQHILKEHQLCLELDQSAQGKVCIRLTMAAFLMQCYLEPILVAFREQHPNVVFDLCLGEDLLDLYAQPIDVAFRISSKFAEGLIAIPLAPIRSIFCAAPSYLAKQSIQTPQDLLSASCLVHQAVEKKSYWQVSRQGLSEQIPVNIAISSNDVRVLQQLCGAGQGVAMLPTALLQEDLATQRLQQLLPEWQAEPFQLCMLYASRKHMPKMTRLFVEAVKQYFLRQAD